MAIKPALGFNKRKVSAIISITSKFFLSCVQMSVTTCTLKCFVRRFIYTYKKVNCKYRSASLVQVNGSERQ